ncbi:unnamed protein product, partial [Boreogadus saida]
RGLCCDPVTIGIQFPWTWNLQAHGCLTGWDPAPGSPWSPEPCRADLIWPQTLRKLL